PAVAAAGLRVPHAMPACRCGLRAGAGGSGGRAGAGDAVLPSVAGGARVTTPIIELRGVSKRFGPTYDAAARMARGLARRLGAPEKNDVVRAVDCVDLTVMRGEVVGLVGESGCGKSTLGRMVAGIMPPSDGQVLFRGEDIATLRPDRAKQAKLK